MDSVASAEVAEPSTGRRRRSVLTAVWLAALIASAVGVVHDQWWPAEAGAMFSFATPTATMGYLVGRDHAGAEVAMPASELGLDDYELSVELRRAMGAQVDFDDLPVLAQMGTWWNEGHPDRRVVEVSLRVRAVELSGGAAHDPTLLTWRSS